MALTRKVLFTASTCSHIKNFHQPYLRWFREQGWEVHVACGGASMPIPFTNRQTDLPFRKRMFAPENLKASRMLRRLIREENYDLISTHTSLAAFFTRLATVGTTRRVMYVANYLFGDGSSAVKRNLILTAERMMASRTELLLTLNEWDCAAAKRYRLAKRVEKVPGLGVDFTRLDAAAELTRDDLRETHGIPQDAFVLLYAAEFSELKSQRVLIEAMGMLPESAVLILCGDGTLRETCRAQAEALELKARVLFPGQVADMPSWYRLADAAVASSRSEGLPFNVMEAMYLGLPVVASAVKGHVDLIADGENGLLYPYGDAKACAARVRSLMEDPSRRKRMGKNAHESALQYGLDRVFPVLTGAYRSVME